MISTFNVAPPLPELAPSQTGEHAGSTARGLPQSTRWSASGHDR